MHTRAWALACANGPDKGVFDVSFFVPVVIVHIEGPVSMVAGYHTSEPPASAAEAGFHLHADTKP